MTFVCFLLLTATLFLRPAELLPAIQGWPIYEVLIASCLLGSFEDIRRQLELSSLARHPISLCAAGVLLAVVLSHATHGSLFGVRTSGEAFLKTLLYYFVLIAQVNTLPRMRLFLMATTLCASLMVLLCVLDYVGVMDFEFVTHVSDRDGVDDAGAVNWVLRMRGTGIFEDPNDLSMVIVAAGVLSFYFLRDEEQGPLRAVWLAPIGLMVLAMLCTRSRGGLLATGAALVTTLYFQRGKWSALGALALGACALPVIAGRQAEISLGGTAAERMDMWQEGFEAIKSMDFFFGIGMSAYSDVAGLVAHNSYLHAFVELGFFGGTLFFGCFFFACLALVRIARSQISDEWRNRIRNDRHLREFVRLHPYVAAVFVSWATSMFSLSRCYVVPTYLVMGTVMAYLLLWRQNMGEGRMLVCFDQPHFVRLVGSSAALLVGLYVFVKLAG